MPASPECSPVDARNASPAGSFAGPVGPSREETMSERPFPLPRDLLGNGKRDRPATHVWRAAAAHLRAAITRNTSPREIARELWHDDQPTQLILRAATGPATTTGSGWADAIAQHAVRDVISTITTLSAGAEVLSRGLQAPLETWAQLTIPGRTLSAANAGNWLAEGQVSTIRPLAVIQGAVLVPKKLMVIQSYTRELAAASLIEDVIKQTVSEASALALDAALFGAQAAGASPAGLLNGVAALTATAGGGLAALTGDFRALFAALAANGAGKGVVFVAAPEQLASLKIMVGPRFDYEVLASQALAAGTLIAIEPSSLVSGFSPTPEFSVGTSPSLHFDDTSPTDITGGTPSPAVPVKSLFQADLLALRMVLRCAWALRANGHVQWISGCTW